MLSRLLLWLLALVLAASGTAQAAPALTIAYSSDTTGKYEPCPV